MTTSGAPGGPLIVLDDDPTGTQAVAEVPVLLDWDGGLVGETVASSPRAIHLLTNSRAFPPESAHELVRGATEAAVAALGRPRLALRGDSTLRAHLLEEYLALCEAAYPGRTPPLLLVPALPPAGRVTIGGVHYLERDGSRMPLHETEYAADPAFAYRDARLLQWAEDRSDGFFSRTAGRELHLEYLRTQGAEAVAGALLELAEARVAAVCAPDAATLEDLAAIADGLRLAEERGAEVVVRSAPTFVGVLAGNLARGCVQPPRPGSGLLVVCGSYVPSSTRQLRALVDAYPESLVEVDVLALASGNEAEVERASQAAGELLLQDRLSVVATPRERPEGTRDFESGQLVAAGLSEIAGRVAPRPGVVLAKGGITSAVTARRGFRARRAICHGPLVDGVALWTLEGAEGERIPYVVFPGNVGDDMTLLHVVELIMGT